EDPDTGPNNLQNWPVMTSAVMNGTILDITGSLNSEPNTLFVIDYYRTSAGGPSGKREGYDWLGSSTYLTNASGNANLSDHIADTFLSSGHGIIATASKTSSSIVADGNTSEFSNCVVIP